MEEEDKGEDEEEVAKDFVVNIVGEVVGDIPLVFIFVLGQGVEEHDGERVDLNELSQTNHHQNPPRFAIHNQLFVVLFLSRQQVDQVAVDVLLHLEVYLLLFLFFFLFWWTQ